MIKFAFLRAHSYCCVETEKSKNKPHEDEVGDQE